MRKRSRVLQMARAVEAFAGSFMGRPSATLTQDLAPANGIEYGQMLSSSRAGRLANPVLRRISGQDSVSRGAYVALR